MKILLTGAAGFIGFHVAKLLLEKGHQVVGLDNINNYYDPQLKYARLNELGISKKAAEVFNQKTSSSLFDKLVFIRLSLEKREELQELFKIEKFDVVCNLAAQAGVRYSLENPQAYIDSNVLGFLNILENCRHFKIKHLVYASSSSVYGLNSKIPFEVTDHVDQPVSLYAATKKSNELMAHTYSHLFGFPTTGLRFFTVYGPWGRPDMALFLFTKAIVNNKPIDVYNNGKMERDFTYIHDITKGVVKVIETKLEERIRKKDLYRLYNIGNNKSVKLLDFIKAIEAILGKNARMILLPMQAGDVEKTWANVDALVQDYDYKPNTPIDEGIKAFVDWYRDFYKV
ncbi:NAD-dependent epimerase [Flavobacteriaceae bacterium D16]|nr:NAD-dependent epimerase [Flavobacteriaceae bacterium D16]